MTQIKIKIVQISSYNLQNNSICIFFSTKTNKMSEVVGKLIHKSNIELKTKLITVYKVCMPRDD